MEASTVSDLNKNLSESNDDNAESSKTNGSVISSSVKNTANKRKAWNLEDNNEDEEDEALKTLNKQVKKIIFQELLVKKNFKNYQKGPPYNFL